MSHHAHVSLAGPSARGGDLVVLWFIRAAGVVVPKRAFPHDEALQSFAGTVHCIF
jgi:hypothetical protein